MYVLTYRNLWLALSILALSTCHRKESPLPYTMIKGRVLETVTMKPIPYAKVYLLGGLYDGSVLSGSVVGGEFMKVEADANGYYEMKIEEEPELMTIVGDAPGYYADQGRGKYGIQSKHINDIDILLPPRCWMKIKVRSESRRDTIALSIVGNWAGDKYNGGGFIFPVEFRGAVDTVFYRPTFGNRINKLYVSERWVWHYKPFPDIFGFNHSQDTLALEVVY